MTAHEILAQLRLCSDAKLSIEDFEEWFDSASWDVHQYGVKPLTDAVFAIESILSDYSAGRADEGFVRRFFFVVGTSLESAIASLSASIASTGTLSAPRIFNLSYGSNPRAKNDLLPDWKGLTMCVVAAQKLELSYA
jgi:hypothetical protein